MKRSLLLIAVSLASGGCTHHRVIYEPANAVLASERKPLRVETMDGRSFVMRDGLVIADTLRAAMEPDGARVDIPVDSIRAITRTRGEVGPGSSFAIGLGVGVLAVGAVIVALLVALAGNSY